MKNDLRIKLNTALQDVDWHGEEQVLQLIRQQRKPIRLGRPSQAMAVAIVLILAMVTTAVALTLHFSASFDKKLQARKAVQTKYGLTDEMLDLFTYEAVDTENDTVASFTMRIAHSERLGSYTVRRLGSGEPDATWSHDGADQTLLDSGSLASPAWGAKQLEHILPLYRQHATGWTNASDYDALTLREKADLDAPLLQMQELGMLINIEPNEGDLSAQEAESIARKAIAEKYGVTEESLSASPAHVSFLLYGGTDRREYHFDLKDYAVDVASPSGEVTACRWMVPEKDRTLPEGDLSSYPVRQRNLSPPEHLSCSAPMRKRASQNGMQRRVWKGCCRAMTLQRPRHASSTRKTPARWPLKR